MNPTKLVYLEDMGLLKLEAQVVAILEEDGKAAIVLDQTVFYPQGGGQPYDTGSLESPAGKFAVEQVRFVDGIVKHVGFFESGSFGKGDRVICRVEQERRQLHRRLHSGGHIVDMALKELGISWMPGKGYHFPQGPYVEYTGSLEGVDTEKLRADLEAKCNEIIARNPTVTIRFMPKEQMHEVCDFVPEYLPAGKPSRVVMYGTVGVPCGGTHVGQLADVGTMGIRKLKNEKGNIRVSYEVM